MENRSRLHSLPWSARPSAFESRRTVSVTDRFTRDKTGQPSTRASSTGGICSLENLWGFWYGMNPNDAEAVLRFTAIERAMADNLRSPDWEPHAATMQDGVFASRFPDHSTTLWTMVNRNEYDVAGPELRVPFHAGIHFYDLWHGTELKPITRGSDAVLSFEMRKTEVSAQCWRPTRIRQPVA